jgi:hypothetical protein
MAFGNVTFGDRAIIFVQGRHSPYFESVVITQPTHLVGSGVGIPGLGGRAFHGRTHSTPLVFGGFVARDIKGTVQIEGFEITGGFTGGGTTTGPFMGPGFPGFAVDGSGIAMENVDHAIIANNYIHVLPSAIGYGIMAWVTGGNTSVIEIRDNTVVNNYNGVLVYAVEGSTVSASITGNNVSHNGEFPGFGRGVEIGVGDFSLGYFSVVGNEFSQNFDMGLFAGTGDHSSATFLIRDNVIISNGRDGLLLQSTGSLSWGTYIVQDNVLSGNGESGLHAQAGGDALTEVYLSGNKIQTNGSHQIHAVTFIGGGAVWFVPTAGASSNTVTETPFDPDSLYFHEGAGVLSAGMFFLLINDVYWPADVDLP